MQLTKKGILLGFLGFIWLVAITIGLTVLLQYEDYPGNAGNPPLNYPQSTNIQRSNKSPTLLVFAHPHCPCTRASIGELEVLTTKCRDRLKTYVVFIEPKEFSEDWVKTDLWQSAKSIPGVQVLVDYNGTEANNFNAKTSGQSILYSKTGELLFNGGITGSRGHYGDNAGRDAIVSIVKNGKSTINKTFVFGCSLKGVNIPFLWR